MGVYVLCHSGVKGMKWGVRRYQNKDGSLTPAGKKRYDNDPSNDGDGLASSGAPVKKKMSKGKKAAIIAGASIGALGIGAAAVIIAKKRGKSAVDRKYNKMLKKNLKDLNKAYGGKMDLTGKMTSSFKNGVLNIDFKN